MASGFLLDLVTRLLTPGETRTEHFAVASPDEALAIELLFASRDITADQTIRVTSTLHPAVLRVMDMPEGDVRSLGCDPDRNVGVTPARQVLAA